MSNTAQWIELGIFIVILLSNAIVLRYVIARNKLLEQQIRQMREERETFSWIFKEGPQALQLLQDAQKAHQEAEKSITQPIYRLQHSTDWFEKLHAVVELGRQIRNPLAVEYLARYSESDKAGLRWHVYTALAQIGTDKGIDLITEKGLNDPEPAIQAHAAHLLGQLKYHPAGNILLSKCDGKHRCVRVNARWAVTQLGRKSPEPQEEGLGQFLAYVLIKGPKGAPDLIHRQLRDIKLSKKCGIVEGGLVSGDYDVMVKVLAENIESLDEIVMRWIQGLSWVESTRTFVVINEPRLYHWRRSYPHYPQYSSQNPLVSYVLIRIPALYSGGLIICLMDIPEVVEAAAVFGECDVIAKIHASTQELRDATVMSKIRKIPSAEFTQTYSVTTAPTEYSYWDDSRDFEFPHEWLI